MTAIGNSEKLECCRVKSKLPMCQSDVLCVVGMCHVLCVYRYVSQAGLTVHVLCVVGMCHRLVSLSMCCVL